MSTIMRTLRNLRRIGIREAAHQMQYIGSSTPSPPSFQHPTNQPTHPLTLSSPSLPHAGDTKAGTLIGTDRYGNRYFENTAEELPLRTRWIDYKDKEYDASQIEPGWHAWISHMVDAPPPRDTILQPEIRDWEPKEHRMNATLSRAAYKPYST